MKSAKQTKNDDKRPTVIASNKTKDKLPQNNDKISIKVPAAMYAKDIGLTFHVNTCVIKKIAHNSFAQKNGSFIVGYVVHKIDTIVPKNDKECRMALDKVRKKGKPFTIIIGKSIEEDKLQSNDNKKETVTQDKTSVEDTINGLKISDQHEETELVKKSNEIIKDEKSEDSKDLENDVASKEAEAEEKAKKEAEEKSQKEAEEKSLKEDEELKKSLNGKIRIIYEMYDEEFDIVDGKLTSEEIDEEFAISFAMPGSHIYLSEISPKERTDLENGPNPDETVPPFKRSSPGIFTNMQAGSIYYCIIVQDEAQFKKDQSKFKRVAKSMMEESLSLHNKADDGRGFETCSCIYGNPCVDEYGCRDWYNRYAVAKKNGWKSF